MSITVCSFLFIIICFINVVRLLKSCSADIHCQMLPITPVQYYGLSSHKTLYLTIIDQLIM